MCPVISALLPDTPCRALRQGREHRVSPGTAPQAQGTYPARCFLDLSEMPSRDMSLLNTMMPTSMFTLGESGAGIRARSPRRGRAGTHHAPGWGLGVPGSGSAHQHDDSSRSHEGVEQTAFQREPAAAGTVLCQGLVEMGPSGSPSPASSTASSLERSHAQPCVPCPHILARCPVAFGPCEANRDCDHEGWQP